MQVCPSRQAGRADQPGRPQIPNGDKAKLLEEYLKKHPGEQALVFGRTKHGSEKLAKLLATWGFKVGSIHGNKSQNQRDRTLTEFRGGELDVLVATDVAARGIDIPTVRHVYNFDLPNVPENYVHRIGRTARAGANGSSISFCAPAEMGELQAIEKLLKTPLPGRWRSAMGGGCGGCSAETRAETAASGRSVRAGRSRAPSRRHPASGRAEAGRPEAASGRRRGQAAGRQLCAPAARRSESGGRAKPQPASSSRFSFISSRTCWIASVSRSRRLASLTLIFPSPMAWLYSAISIPNRCASATTSLVHPRRGRVPLFAAVIGQRDAAQVGQRRRHMGKAAGGFKLRHHVERHEPVVMFVAVRIVATKRGLRFSGDLAGGFDADILHQGLAVLFQIGRDRHDQLPVPRGVSDAGKHQIFFPLIQWEVFVMNKEVPERSGTLTSGRCSPASVFGWARRIILVPRMTAVPTKRGGPCY